VFAYGETFDYHYNGFSKAVLWPLLHGIPPASIYSINRNIPVDKAWSAYLQVNEAFAQQILQFYTPETDVIWIHDYHLFLLPFIIRQQLPDVTIGFFLHTCFPSSEIFRILPYRKQILQGMLASDVIAVQTSADAHHLMTSCTKILGCTRSDEGVTSDKGHFTQIKVSPIGVDLGLIQHFKEEAIPAGVKQMLLKENKDRIVLVSVDEMDYVKGITHKLSAFEHFLETYPELRQKVVLIQIVFPGRSDCEEYHALQSAVNEQVGRINSTYATVDSLPIRYVNRYVSKPELLSIFAASRVAIITPLKDGMNLLPFQYIACQDVKDPGSLIVSEFAGCSSSLRSAAAVINPWDTDEFAEAIYSGINFDLKTRVEKHEKLMNYVENHTVQSWANEQVDTLMEISHRRQEE
jgi:trehalose-6-phosphate synthase